MHKLLFILLFPGTFNALCQDTLVTLKRSDLGEPHDFSYQKKWKYFELIEITKIEILDHIPSIPCGGYASSSLTIGRTEKGDTIRVIDYCNSKNTYKTGQIIMIAPRKKPERPEPIPFTLVKNPQTNKHEPSTFDLLVIRTTWGTLID
jgi:hypothetical protein